MSKTDFKKTLKHLYSAPTKGFEAVDVPPLQYLMIDGHGDPNTAAEYKQAIETIYPIAYKLKFLSKAQDRDYVVPPLEGLWWAENMQSFQTRDKDSWNWTMMIMTPDWISQTDFEQTVIKLKAKSAPPAIDKVRLEALAEGLCAQTLHIGSYDDETATLAQLHDEWLPVNGYTETGKHHEIYLSDPRRTAPEKLRTILRQPIVVAPETEPVEYINRTRRYYQALGYGKPYDWAHFDSVPFSHPTKPVSDCTVGIVSTAAPFHSDKGDQSPGAPYNAAAKFFSVYRLPIHPQPDLRVSHIAIDRDHTTAEDPGSYFPLNALETAWRNGRIGKLANHVYGLPTNRSQPTTMNTDCQELVRLVKEDGIDIAVLVPNCPVCHQSVSLAARALEEAGVLTVILGCAKDIVEHVGVPRFLFSDFPLGNSAGIPGDTQCQQGLINAALDLVESATSPRTTIQSAYKWPGASQWKADYSNPDKLSEEDIHRTRAAFDAAKAVAKKR